MGKPWSSSIRDFIYGVSFPDAKDNEGLIEPWAIPPRPFTWNEEQIAMLFDSIMRGFPIGTLLVWPTDRAVKNRNFVVHWPDSTASGADVLLGIGHKEVLLDGHQRLQSLLIGLAGSYHGRELYFDVTSGDATSADGLRYRFAFRDGRVDWPWVRIKSVLGEVRRDRLGWPAPSEDVISAAVSGGNSEATRQRIGENLTLAILQLGVGGYSLPLRFISCMEFNGSRTYATEEAAEIFKRANPCGTAPDRFLASIA